MKRTTTVLTLAATFAVGFAGQCRAQEWPSKPIRMIVPTAPGTATDTVARVLAESMSNILKQHVIIQNKVGLNGSIGSREVAQAAPDGYTLLNYSSGHVSNIFLIKDLQYDPLRDFTPISLTLNLPQLLTVRQGLNATTVAELTQLAKNAPGKLNFGAGAATGRIGMELYKQLAGVDILYVPYNGNAQAMTDLQGGRIDMMIIDLATAAPRAATGGLRILAVARSARVKSLPNIPTMAEAGVPGYELTSWTAVWGPPKMPRALATRINQVIAEALKSPPMQRIAESLGAEIPVASPAEFERFEREDIERWRKATTAANIKPE